MTLKEAKKKPLSKEKVTINFAFASVVSKTKISKGEKLTKKNIELKRPGTGDYGVNDFDKLIGKSVRKYKTKYTNFKKSFLI